MLPKNFSFTVKGGSGIVYRASSENERCTVKWTEDSEEMQTAYPLMQVVDFVTAGQWKIIS